ncbi:glyoxylate reductase [Tremella mesenterica]|uniref:Glyoxylate reductase n=1 Tax=Tremella mesenterica TaxID=5217 RepID=A0A4Q1BE82_TREME|nr:glyoxylate reductase [Tremella mesenterica]
MSILASSGLEAIINPHDAAPSREWVLGHLADPEVRGVCLTHSQPSDKVDDEFLKACNENLKVVSTFSVGYDHIDIEGAKRRGIKIGHTPGVLSDAVADITVMLVLMTLRRVEEGISLVKSGGWSKLPWAPFILCGPSISHPSLVLSFLGFGRISQHVLSRLLAFTSKIHPPQVQYVSSHARPNQMEIDQQFSDRFGVKVKRVERDQLASESDILIVLCDLNPSTKDYVNSEFLGKMKRTAVLVNAARGPIVNSDDLAHALSTGQIFGAGLDVITGEPDISSDHPLVKAQNCVIIPHMGSADVDTRKAMAELCVRNAIAGAKGDPMPAMVQ